MMLRSERSSLSSFRDYYDHSSSRLDRSEEEELIIVGLRHFLVRKVMRRIDRSLSSAQHWLKAYAFRLLHKKESRDEKRIRARSALQSVMAKMEAKGSQIGIASHSLHIMLEETRH